MRRILFFLLALSFINLQAADKKGKAVRIVYESSSHGEIMDGHNTIMEISNNLAKITTVSKKESRVPSQTIYLDFDKNEEIKTSNINAENIHTIRKFEINKGLEAKEETAVISGYICKKLQTIINSNTLEIWYTSELGLKGSMQPSVGIADGVILKIVRNGQMAETAKKIEILDQELDLKPHLSGEALKASAYNYKIQQSQVLTFEVFENESVFFKEIPKLEQLSDTEVMHFASGSIVLKKIKLPEDNNGYSIFVELAQHSEGDAYDRTGSVFIIPTNKKESFLDGLLKGTDSLPKYTDKHGNAYQGMVVTEDYLPPVELMRFYTSFGVRGYNHIEVAEYNWPDSVAFSQEVTDYAKLLKGEVWIAAWIGNWVENGHNVDLDIKLYPRGKTEEKEVYPLFTTTNLLEMAGQEYPESMFRDDMLTVNFSTQTDLKDAYIRYISTGHGGWGGGDEFNPKLNTIYVDGKQIMAYTPWREDCKSYREYNPASGNFANGLSSSDLSRSGWCPGTVSYPVFIHLGEVKAGTHQLKLSIPVGDPAGNSHSYWCTSGVLVGTATK